MTEAGRHPVIAEDLAAIIAAPLPWERLAGKRVLVTGASGILAGYVVETLLYLNEARGLGIRVLGLVRDRAKAEARFAHHRGRADLELLVQDVTDPVRLDGPLGAIVHAASQASPKYFGADPVGTLLPNVVGTRNLLELAREKGSEALLFLSSGEVYGVVDPSRIPIKENDYGFVDPMNVRSCYAEGKRAGETLCVAYHKQHGVPATVVRPFHTYGPGMPLDDGRVFSDFVADIVAGRSIVMKSDGRARRPFCYVADAVAGFFTALLLGKPAEAYNVGNEDAEVSVLELADRLVALFPERRLSVVRQPEAPRAAGYLESPIPRNCPDTTKLRALGWRPAHGIESGFARTVRSYA